MRITNAVQTISFDSLDYGQFFSFVTGEEGNIAMKCGYRDYRRLINGRVSADVESVGHAMVFPLELSTCRFVRSSTRV